jgi:glutamate-1-semialdehyde 2,1-aminomutase
VFDYESAKKADTARFAKFFNHMLERGIYLAPSQFEAGFVGMAHLDSDIDETRAAARQFFEAE